MDAKVQFWEGAMVGGHKWGRFERSDDAKVQIWEGVIMGGHKCVMFEGSEDAKAKLGGSDGGRPQMQEV